MCVDTLSGRDFYRCLLGRYQDGFVFFPRETLGCMSTHYWVVPFIGVLGRCQDGLVFVPRDTLGCVSTHYWVVPFIGVYSGDDKMVWFL